MPSPWHRSGFGAGLRRLLCPPCHSYCRLTVEERTITLEDRLLQDVRSSVELMDKQLLPAWTSGWLER